MKKVVSLSLVLVLIVCLVPTMIKGAKAGQYDYSLKFDAQGGHIGSVNGPGTKTVSLPPSSYSAGLECSANRNIAYRTGYAFLGWFDANGKQYQSGVTGSPAIVYAHWRKLSTSNQYVTCNDAPDVVHEQKVNEPCDIWYRDYIEVGSMNSFSVGGWAIHDRGVESYSYKICDADNKNTYCTGKLNANNGEPAIKGVSEVTGIARETWEKNARYSGTVNIKGLDLGKYIVHVYGSTTDGQSFEVCKVHFSIVKKHQYIWKHLEYRYEENGQVVNQEDVCVCKTCNRSGYNEYLQSTGMHWVACSGSNENGLYNRVITGHNKSAVYNGKSGDQTGTEWAMKEFYYDHDGKILYAVLRYNGGNETLNRQVRLTLAKLSIDAALNNKIGYTQNSSGRDSYRMRLLKYNCSPSLIVDVCDQDCSGGICANIKAAGYILGIDELKNHTATATSNMEKNLVGTKKAGFIVLKGENLPDKDMLLPGDILLYSNGETRHAAVNVTAGLTVQDRDKWKE
ncbi:MAG: hypothetical protein IKX20_02160 [Paludibacteraceae bacterium]|nr:hypothetical protein [Paludibacteraceae bacterium]